MSRWYTGTEDVRYDFLPDADKVFEWAKAHHDRRGRYPKVRDAARRFRCRQSEIEAVVDGDYQEGYMGLGVGMRIGSGVYEFKTLGDCVIEAYD